MKIQENGDLRSVGICGAVFTLNFKKRIARKLRRIILLDLGLELFDFDFGKPRKPFMFMVFIFGRDHVSQNQLSLTLGPSNYSKQSKKRPRNIFENAILGNLKILDISL